MGDGSDIKASRLAGAITATVLFGYMVNTAIAILGTPLEEPALLGAGLCLVILFALQLLHSTQDLRLWPRRTLALTLTVQTFAVFIPFMLIEAQAAAAAGFLAGSILLAINRPIRWALYGGIGAMVGLILLAKKMLSIDVVYGTYFTLLTGLVVYGISSLADQIAEIHATRGDLSLVAVTHERLRVARDLHDMIGHNLSAITLRSEVAYRLLPMVPQRVRDEVASVIEITRRARAEMRMIPGGIRYMSLSAEAESMASTLTVANIDTEVEIVCGQLPADLDTVLALLLREAVTNVLRHSKARQCIVKCTEQGGMIYLQVSNDGVSAIDNSPGAGTGLNNLSTRLAQVNGRLSVTREDGGWFRLVAEAHLTERPPARSDKADDEVWPTGVPDSWSHLGNTHAGGQWGPRTALTITLLVLIGYLLVTLINILGMSLDAPELFSATVCLAVAFGLQIAISCGRPRLWSWRTRALALSAQALVTFVPLLWIGHTWGSMAGFLAGSVLLVGTGPARWAAYGMLGAAVATVTVVMSGGQPPGLLVYLTLSTLLTGLVVYGISSLFVLVNDVHAARREVARLAVMQERLQLTRDLHDLLDHSLSAMALKSELALRLIPEAPDHAKLELENLLLIARKAVAGVRAMSSGYKHMSLGGEIESAAATLSAAGVRVQTDVSGDVLPTGVNEVLAIAVRKIISCAPPYSPIDRCVISVERDSRSIRLGVRFEGAAPDLASLAEDHTMMELRDRLGGIGGRLLIETTDGGFSLIAEVQE